MKIITMEGWKKLIFEVSVIANAYKNTNPKYITVIRLSLTGLLKIPIQHKTETYSFTGFTGSLDFSSQSKKGGLAYQLLPQKIKQI